MHPQAVPEAIFLTEPEAARLLRLSQRTLQRFRCQGGGPPFTRVGVRRLVYSRRQLLVWADARRRGSSPDNSTLEHTTCSTSLSPQGGDVA